MILTTKRTSFRDLTELVGLARWHYKLARERDQSIPSACYIASKHVPLYSMMFAYNIAGDVSRSIRDKYRRYVLS